VSALTSLGVITFRRAEPVMGTVVSFEVRPQGLPAIAARSAMDDACSVLRDADEMFSLYRDDSPLSRIRRGELAIGDASPEIAQIVDHCVRVRDLSGGWFDPWAMPGGFDPTGLVKGWAAESALAVLSEVGVGAAMINAAGDIALLGTPEPGRRWRIGIRTPDDPDQLSCIAEPSGAVATSGQYERGPHVLDPSTGLPATAAISATVCGPELTVADGLATGLLAAGRRGLGAITAAGYEGMIIDKGEALVHTSGFPIVG
jgi:thiamine biosynthesis lipoprotein